MHKILTSQTKRNSRKKTLIHTLLEKISLFSKSMQRNIISTATLDTNVSSARTVMLPSLWPDDTLGF